MSRYYTMQFLKLRPFIQDNIENLNWEGLSKNPNAIRLLEENPDKINC